MTRETKIFFRLQNVRFICHERHSKVFVLSNDFWVRHKNQQQIQNTDELFIAH